MAAGVMIFATEGTEFHGRVGDKKPHFHLIDTKQNHLSSNEYPPKYAKLIYLIWG